MNYIHTTEWMKVENIILGERSPLERPYHVYEMQADLLRQRLVVVLGWGGENGETGGIMAKQYSGWNLACGPRVKTLHTQ